MDKLLMSLFCILLIAALVIYNGYALMLCWNWTLPVLFGLPRLVLSHAIALDTLIGFLVFQYVPIDTEDVRVIRRFVSYSLLKPLLAILIVWLCMVGL